MVPSIKLFVILGTQKFPFNRLMKALDELIEKGIYKPEEVYIQSAYYDYIPQKAKYCKLLPPDEFIFLIKTASVVITHAGVNSILTCMQQNKHFLVVPRLKQYGEHVDNHQKEIVKDFNDKGYIIGIENVEQLKDAILKAKEFEPVKYKHNNEKMLKIIQEFIDK